VEPLAAPLKPTRQQKTTIAHITFLQNAEEELLLRKKAPELHFPPKKLVFLGGSDSPSDYLDPNHPSNNAFLDHERWVLDVLHKLQEIPDSPKLAAGKSKTIDLFTTEASRLRVIEKEGREWQEDQQRIHAAELLFAKTFRQQEELAGATVDTGSFTFF
jgi:hypothetical protein